MGSIFGKQSSNPKCPVCPTPTTSAKCTLCPTCPTLTSSPCPLCSPCPQITNNVNYRRSVGCLQNWQVLNYSLPLIVGTFEPIISFQGNPWIANTPVMLLSSLYIDHKSIALPNYALEYYSNYSTSGETRIRFTYYDYPPTVSLCTNVLSLQPESNLGTMKQVMRFSASASYTVNGNIMTLLLGNNTGIHVQSSDLNYPFTGFTVLCTTVPPLPQPSASRHSLVWRFPPLQNRRYLVVTEGIMNIIRTPISFEQNNLYLFFGVWNLQHANNFALRLDIKGNESSSSETTTSTTLDYWDHGKYSQPHVSTVFMSAYCPNVSQPSIMTDFGINTNGGGEYFVLAGELSCLNLGVVESISGSRQNRNMIWKTENGWVYMIPSKGITATETPGIVWDSEPTLRINNFGLRANTLFSFYWFQNFSAVDTSGQGNGDIIEMRILWDGVVVSSARRSQNISTQTRPNQSFYSSFFVYHYMCNELPSTLPIIELFLRPDSSSSRICSQGGYLWVQMT